MHELKELLEKLPGARIARIAAKEIAVIKSQWFVLGLILLMLIIVVFIIGLAFTGKSTLENLEIAVYAPANIRGFDSEKFIKQLEDTNKITILRAVSSDDVERIIYERQSKVGIIVHEPETRYGRYVIDVVFDNSNIATSLFFFDVARQAVQSVGFQTSLQLLQEIWENLSQIKSDLQGEVERVEKFLQQLDESELTLLDLNESVTAINIDEMREVLNSQRNRNDVIKAKLDQYTSDVEFFSGEIEGLPERLEQHRLSIADYRQKGRDAVTRLEERDRQLAEIEQDLDEVNSQIPGGSPQIEEALLEIRSARAEISSARSDIEAAEAEMNSAEQEIVEMQESVIAIQGKLETTDASLKDLKGEIDSTFTDLDSINEQLSSIGSTIDEIIALIDDSLESKKDVDSDLEESKELMASFIDSLDELGNLDPQFLSNPVIINKLSAYNVDKFTILVPSLIAIVIMLTAILLSAVVFINEKIQGAYLRMVLSTTKKYKLFIGKIFGQIIFSVFLATIILVVSIISFNVPIAGNIAELYVAFALASFAFVALGLFITNFTRLQSTTLLTALVIMIPLIFLSGIILPVELMSEIVSSIAEKLPLNISILIVTEVLVKGNTLLNLAPEILLLVIPSLVLLLFTVKNKRID